MYVSLEEAAERGWKSKSAWKLSGQKLKNQPPVAVVYRKTEKSIGLSYRNQEYISTVLSALVAIDFSDFPAGVESGEGLDAARRKLRRVPRIGAIAGAVNYASARHIAKYFARAAKL